MVLVLMIVWVVLSLVVGVLIGKGIRRADVVGPSPAEPAWWDRPSGADPADVPTHASPYTDAFVRRAA